MESPILKQIAEFLQDRKKQKRWMVVFVFMAVIVGFGTAAALRMMGQAMTQKEKVLDCQLQLHEHTKACYDKNKNVICGYADYVVHKHNDDCYNSQGKLMCRLPEVEKHEHTKACYEKTETLVCGQDETDGHKHTDDCYTTEKGDLKCKKEEHSHSDGCYDEEGNLACGLDEHQHDDDCYKWEDVLVCGAKEGEGGHKHTDKCYDVQEALTCGKLEMHTHTDKCFEKIDKNGKDEPGNLKLVCGKTELIEHTHTTEAECLRTVDAAEADVIQAELEKEAEEEAGEITEDGREIFTTDLGDEETEGEEASEGEEAGEETEGDAVEGETGEESEEAEPENYETSKTYEGLGYIVTASYNNDANIPEEAKLVAERITEESDEDSYKKHEVEFKKNMEDEEATLSALFKIGFYVDGEEVEPETPVMITIQFVDKNGLPEGAPVKVVHFGDEETEVLDGGKAESGSTSFKTNSFSVFGVGFNKETDAEKADSESISVSESYRYESDAFNITFHIEGEATYQKSETKEDADSSKKEENSEEVTELTDNEENSDKDSGEGKTEDGSDTEDASNENKNEESKFHFEVNVLDENSEDYKEFSTYAEGLDDNSELFLVKPMTYSLSYDGNSLDLSECKVKATLTPKTALDTYAKETISNLDSDEGEEKKEEEKSEKITEGKENPIQIDVVIAEPSQAGINQVATATYWNEDLVNEETTDADSGTTGNGEEEETKANNNVDFESNSTTFVVTASGTAYPDFTVQYYAYLDSLVTRSDWCTPTNPISSTGVDTYAKNLYPHKTSDLRALSLIDTSKTTGIGKLPENGVNYGNASAEKLKNLALVTKEEDEKNAGKVKTELKLTEVYSAQTFTFNMAPNINYFDALDENKHYKLKEIWVLNEGGDPTSTESDAGDWTVVTYSDDIGFTNRKETADSNPNYIWINDKTVMRLVYNAETDAEEFDATFYDYDISNGTTTNNGVSIMNTNKAGINSSLDVSKTTNQYAFGNQNCGVNESISHGTWNGYHLNMTNADKGYLGCTFGLVQGVNNKNELVFADGIKAPVVFGSAESKKEDGKTPYDAKLTFNQKGDTYTLTSASGTNVNVSNLDRFNHPKCGAATYDHILTNNFWPLDGVPADKRKDMLFGKNGQQTNQKFGSGSWDRLPAADDGDDHNCFFGMFYEVEFTLSEEYVGPLEYLFYGDDDMWVFLDDKELVCDIGGVHSSVGEYVDLWDYLGSTDENGNVVRKAKNGAATTHTLKFFYTERGASGSSCWMQFTLPSVTSRNTDPASGRLTNSLTVSKTVSSENYAGIDLNRQYEFEINFKKTDDVPLLNNYGYKKYRKIRKFDENGQPVVDNKGNPVYEQVENDKGELVDKVQKNS